MTKPFASTPCDCEYSDWRKAAMMGYPITTSRTSMVGVSSMAARRPLPSVLDLGGFLPSGAALVGASVTAMEPSFEGGAAGRMARRPGDDVRALLLARDLFELRLQLRQRLVGGHGTRQRPVGGVLDGLGGIAVPHDLRPRLRLQDRLLEHR